MSTFPPRWQPSALRWHHTRIGFLRAWWYALGAVWATWKHTIFDFVAALPGRDDVIRAWAPTPVMLVRNPEYARQILVTNQDNYMKGVEYDLLAVGLGRGLVTNLDDESWRRHRRIVQPVFGKRHVDGFAAQIADTVGQALDRWDREYAAQPLDVAAEMNAVTLDIIARTMFGADLSGRANVIREDFARLLRAFGTGVMAGVGRPARFIARLLHRFGPDRLAAQDPRLVIRVLRAGLRVIEPSTHAGLLRIESLVDELIEEQRASRRRSATRRTSRRCCSPQRTPKPGSGCRWPTSATS
jgi:cytochrome P450